MARVVEAFKKLDLIVVVDPFPTRLERVLKFFGFVALGTGLAMIGLIVYAMLIGYR